MAIAEGKKRISITLTEEQIEKLQQLVTIYAADSLGKVTASDVVEQLIKNDYEIRTTFKQPKKSKR